MSLSFSYFSHRSFSFSLSTHTRSAPSHRKRAFAHASLLPLSAEERQVGYMRPYAPNTRPKRICTALWHSQTQNTRNARACRYRVFLFPFPVIPLVSVRPLRFRSPSVLRRYDPVHPHFFWEQFDIILPAYVLPVSRLDFGGVGSSIQMPPPIPPRPISHTLFGIFV